MIDYFIVGGAAFLMSIVSATAGAGGGLVMSPLMLLLGFPPQVVLASNKAAGLGLNLGALSKFIRKKGTIDWRLAAILSVLAVAASFVGTQLVFILSGAVLKHLIIAVALILVPIVFLQRKMGLTKRKVSKRMQILGIVTYFLVMVLQSGIGSGIGILSMFILIGLMGFDALGASATKRVSGLVLVVTSFTIFAFSDYMNWALALSLFVGMLAGGYLGAHLAIRHGNKLIKNTLLAVAVAVAIAAIFFA